MKTFRKKIYAAAGYTTLFLGSGRKEFRPDKKMPSFEQYLKETAEGTIQMVPHPEFDEGIIGSFMPSRFLKQGNIPGFLPFMVPSLQNKPCTGVEGACGTGGRAIAEGIKTVLSDLADSVFVSGFEVQNTVKAVYGADILAGAAYYQKERKSGHAFFFPGIFSERAGAYYQRYGYRQTRQAMARWYENSIINARMNPKAQEFQNITPNLYELALTDPSREKFVPHLNLFDCSKVSDGAASIVIASEEGLKKLGISLKDSVEIIAMGAAEADITQDPQDLTELSTTAMAGKKALEQAGIVKDDIAFLELHDCFTISGLLALEALGFAQAGKAPEFILEGNIQAHGKIPINLSGGLGGFGHPTGATGVRQLVDLWAQLTGKAANQIHLKSPFGMMVSMGGNDKTVTTIIAKSTLED